MSKGDALESRSPEILEGKLDAVPEQDFYLAGNIQEVKERFETRKKEEAKA